MFLFSSFFFRLPNTYGRPESYVWECGVFIKFCDDKSTKIEEKKESNKKKQQQHRIVVLSTELCYIYFFFLPQIELYCLFRFGWSFCFIVSAIRLFYTHLWGQKISSHSIHTAEGEEFPQHILKTETGISKYKFDSSMKFELKNSLFFECVFLEIFVIFNWYRRYFYWIERKCVFQEQKWSNSFFFFFLKKCITCVSMWCNVSFLFVI